MANIPDDLDNTPVVQVTPVTGSSGRDFYGKRLICCVVRL
jgi:hypothetical protein